MRHIYCLSLSHHHSDIDTRSQYSVAEQDLEGYLEDLKRVSLVCEACLLSTCNRFEVVFIGKEDSDPSVMQSWLAYKSGTDVDDVCKSFRTFQGVGALKHIFKVTSGLDAKIFGETNINGQVKQALELSRKYDLMGKTLNFIYQNAFMTSKEIQSRLELPMNSISRCFFKAHKNTFDDPTGKTFLMLGSGKLCSEVVKMLDIYQPKDIYVVSRNPKRVSQYLHEVATKVGTLEEIAPHFNEVDSCFTATNISEPLLDENYLSMFAKNKPILIADSSLPPAVDTVVDNFHNIAYQNVDDLANLSQESNVNYVDLEKDLDTFIEKAVFGLQKKLDSNFMQNVIQPERLHLRQYINHIKEWIERDFNEHKSPEKTINLISRELSGFLMHVTTLLLKECCKNYDVDMIHELKGLIDKHDHIIEKEISNHSSK